HHQLRFPDSGPYSRPSCGPVGAELLEDSLFSYRSRLLWSCGVNACHRSMDQARSLRATPLTVLRTAAWSNGLPDRVQERGMDYKRHCVARDVRQSPAEFVP